jgi:hypothetical protein
MSNLGDIFDKLINEHVKEYVKAKVANIVKSIIINKNNTDVTTGSEEKETSLIKSKGVQY